MKNVGVDIKSSFMKAGVDYLSKKPSFAIETLGCSKNTVDSEYMAAYLVESGFEITDSPAKADYILINTCSFIMDAKLQSIDLVVEMAELKTEYPEKRLLVTGCLAERYAKDLALEIPEIDAFVGTSNYDRILEVIGEIEGKKKEHYRALSIDMTGDINRVFLPTVQRLCPKDQHYAYLKISEGCNNSCAFCIIPKLKGRYRSRHVESLIEEATLLAKNGAKELIVIAQDISRYGVDLESGALKGSSALIGLLTKLEDVDGIEWIRLHYMYPDIVGDELIDYIAKSKKVLPYFDIPLQHVSNSVLKRMRRSTNKEKILSLIGGIRRKLPNATIRSTFIVGFPGETEEDYEELYNFLSEYKLDRVGVFEYSDEEGTSSYLLDDKVSEDEKALRHGRLMDLLEQNAYERQLSRIGNVESVIVDGFDGEKYLCRSKGDSPDIDGNVFLVGEAGVYSEGEIIELKILDAETHDVYGIELKKLKHGIS